MRKYESPQIQRAGQRLAGAFIGTLAVAGGTAAFTYGIGAVEAASHDAGHQDLAYELEATGDWLVPRELVVGSLVVLVASGAAARASASYDKQRPIVPGPTAIPLLTAPERPGLAVETTQLTYERVRPE